LKYKLAEVEKEQKMLRYKQHGVTELQGISSFDKQEKNV
jgi:hypothetical protein